MLRGLGVLAAVTLIAGCDATPMPRAAAGAGGDGQASKLRPGMSENDAFAIFGPETGFERNPDNFDQSCLSYAYGDVEAPRYVHARFEMGSLVQATDGHTAICTFDPVIAEAAPAVEG